MEDHPGSRVALDAAAIAARFDLGRARSIEGPVARGELGAVWRLETDRGVWAVKVPFAAPTEAEVSEGAAFQEAAAAWGVPAPPVVRTADGCVLADLDGVVLRVFPWVDLRDPDPSLDAAAVGALLASIHTVPFAGTAPVDPWYAEPVGAARWDASVRAAAAAGAPFAGALGAARDELVALEAWIAPPRSLRTCHRDLFADNLRATVGGALCVIDWDNVGLADPAQELVLVAFEFGRRSPARLASFAGAYRSAGGPARVEGEGDASMLVAVMGHLAALHVERWLAAPSDGPVRRRAAAGVREVLDDLHGRATLRSLLNALTSI